MRKQVSVSVWMAPACQFLAPMSPEAKACPSLRRSDQGLNHGKKSRKFNQGCTIYQSCCWNGSDVIVWKWPDCSGAWRESGQTIPPSFEGSGRPLKRNAPYRRRLRVADHRPPEEGSWSRRGGRIILPCIRNPHPADRPLGSHAGRAGDFLLSLLP